MTGQGGRSFEYGQRFIIFMKEKNYDTIIGAHNNI